MARRSRTRDSPPISLFAFQDIMAAVTGVLIMVTLILAIEPLAEELLAESSRPAGARVPAPMAEPDEVPPEDEPPMALETAQRLVADLETEIERRRRAPVVDARRLEDTEFEVAALRAIERDVRSRSAHLAAALEAATREAALASERAAAATRARDGTAARLGRESLRARVRFLPGERYDKAPLFVEVRPDGCVVGGFDEAGVPTVLADGRAGAQTPSTPDALERLLGGRSPDAFQLVFIVRQDALAPFVRLRDEFHERGWDVGWQLWDAGEGGFFDAPTTLGSAPP